MAHFRIAVSLVLAFITCGGPGGGHLGSGGGDVTGNNNTSGGGGGGNNSNNNTTGGGTDGGSGSGVPLPGGITGTTFEARVAAAKDNVETLAQAMCLMRDDTGSQQASCLSDLSVLGAAQCPSVCDSPSGGALQSCTAPDALGFNCWGGPYLEQALQDPWGIDYQATVDQSTWLITVTSAGPDQVFGTADDIISPPC
jgi:hypothetical protein